MVVAAWLPFAPPDERQGSMKAIRRRFWFEGGLAAVSGFLAVLTIFRGDWFEVTGFNPDNHSGSFEWVVVAVFFVVCAWSCVAARIEWRGGRQATATSS